MYALKDSNSNYLVSSAGYFRPTTKAKASRYSLDDASFYQNQARLSGFTYSIEKV